VAESRILAVLGIAAAITLGPGAAEIIGGCSATTIEGGVMGGFVQIIEMQTSRIDEIEELLRELRNRLDEGRSSAPRRGTITEDRDRPGFYISIVEFDSYEAAMENSGRPEVNEYAARLAKLCDAPPKFANLDVRESWQPGNR
jgi:hypothetical protein